MINACVHARLQGKMDLFQSFVFSFLGAILGRFWLPEWDILTSKTAPKTTPKKRAKKRAKKASNINLSEQEREARQIEEP